MTAVSSRYSSSDGDMLDMVALAHYGSAEAVVLDAVLAANPGLAAVGPVWPAGLEITLPVVATPQSDETAQLWG